MKVRNTSAGGFQNVKGMAGVLNNYFTAISSLPGTTLIVNQNPDSGAQFSTLEAALLAASSTSAEHPYTILLGTGEYSGTVLNIPPNIFIVAQVPNDIYALVYGQYVNSKTIIDYTTVNFTSPGFLYMEGITLTTTINFVTNMNVCFNNCLLTFNPNTVIGSSSSNFSQQSITIENSFFQLLGVNNLATATISSTQLIIQNTYVTSAFANINPYCDFQFYNCPSCNIFTNLITDSSSLGTMNYYFENCGINGTALALSGTTVSSFTCNFNIVNSYFDPSNRNLMINNTSTGPIINVNTQGFNTSVANWYSGSVNLLGNNFTQATVITNIQNQVVPVVNSNLLSSSNLSYSTNKLTIGGLSLSGTVEAANSSIILNNIPISSAGNNILIGTNNNPNNFTGCIMLGTGGLATANGQLIISGVSTLPGAVINFNTCGTIKTIINNVSPTTSGILVQ